MIVTYKHTKIIESIQSGSDRRERRIATMEYKTQYDMEGSVIPARRRCCSLSTSVVWLLLVAALCGGFAGAFLYHQLSGRAITQVSDAKCPDQDRADIKLAFAKKATGDYLVVFKMDSLMFNPEVQSLDEFGSCMPAENRKTLQAVPPGIVFIVRLHYNGEGQCVFDCLRQIDVFGDHNSEEDVQLLEALTDHGIDESLDSYI